ncbi:MAG: insulinase family protein [Candidatus Algichlamydia australiensis]|nr:insulinase family protein [Chlamydiales bacterium]
MKKLLLLLFPLILSASLQIDREIIAGQLENGLTYYIKRNELPQERAYLKLYVDVGYFDGTEDEVGIAHLLEHLALIQTEDYADYEIVKFLNSIGAPLGPDSNAHTSFYETQYKLDIPLKKKGILVEAISLLSGIAGRAKFTEAVLEKEKEVVQVELGQRNSHEWRSFVKFLRWQSDDQLCYDESSRCVAAATVDSVRDFYKRYYRPDRMALFIVGSVEPEEVEEIVKEKFSSLENSKLQIEKREPIEIDSGKSETSYVHKDVGKNRFSIGGWVPSSQMQAEEDVKQDLCLDLFLSLLNERFSHLIAEEGAPILNAGADFELLPRQKKHIFSLDFTPFEKREEEAFTQLVPTLQAALQGEFGKESFLRHCATKKDYVESVYKNLHRRKNRRIADHLSSSFAKGEAPIDSASFLQLKREILEGLSYEEFQKTIREEFSNFSPWISYFGATEIDLNPLSAVLTKPWSGESLAEIKQKELYVSPQAEGEIAVQSLYLSNGMEVILRKTDFEKDQLHLLGYAKGGQLSLPSEYYNASKIALDYQVEAGFGGLKKLEFRNFLDQKKVGCELSLDKNLRTFQAVSFCGQHEALFQLVHALFTNHNSSKSAFENRVAAWREVQEHERNKPNLIVTQALHEQLFNKHPLFEEIDLGRVTKEDCEKVFTHAFSNPSEFTLIITGDFDMEQMKRHVRNYLATIPLRKLFFSFSQVEELSHSSAVEKKTLYVGEEETATTFFHIPLPAFTKEERIPPHFFQRLISDGLFEILRHQLGVSYTPVARIVEPLYPSRSCRRLLLIVTTTPELASQHLPLIEEVFEHMRATPPTEEIVEGVKEEIRHSIKRSLETSNGWINSLLQTHFENRSYQEIGDMTYLDEVTAERVHQAITKILDYQDAASLTWMPASYQGEEEAI